MTNVEYRKDFIADIVFSDGLQFNLDLKLTVKNDRQAIVQEPLDPDLFVRVTVDEDTLTWPYCFDLALDFLYELARGQGAAQE